MVVAADTHTRTALTTHTHDAGFGQPSKDYLSHQDSTLETTFEIILKTNCCTPSNILALHETHPLLSHLLCTCTHLKHCSFLGLSKYLAEWEQQDHLCIEKACEFLACLLHFISALQTLCGSWATTTPEPMATYHGSPQPCAKKASTRNS